MNETDEIVMYGADWCGDCRRSQRLMDARAVRYRSIDVEHDAEAREEARRLGGSTKIPVIVMPDGSVLVEPTDPELATRLDELAVR
ncbi:MAG: glutaredoxin family protein [Actinomycetota bacterium]